jgi:hypothetical protein
VPSTHTFTADGAVPYLGDLLIQLALAVDVQLRIPPPVLLMDKDPDEGQQKPRTIVRPSHQAGTASSNPVRLRAIVGAVCVRLCDAACGLVGVSEAVAGLVGVSVEQAAITSRVVIASAV